MLGTDIIGNTTLNLPKSSLALKTYALYYNGMREFAALCH
jgi:hypothetical protein